MTNLWPILTLLPPLAVTVFGGRSAWLWLSLVASLALMFGLVEYVIYQFGQGNTDPLFKTLLVSNSVDRAYHDTYYVITNVHALTKTVLPALIIGPLLLIAAHPRRAVTDIVLFWGVVAFALIAHFGVVVLFGMGGMPRRFVDYDEVQHVYLVGQIASLITIILAIIAALRPLRSWWIKRRAS